MSNLMNTGQGVQIATAVSSAPAASAATVSLGSIGGDGVAKYALVQVVKNAGTGDGTLGAGCKLVGDCMGRRVVLCTLNSGQAIVVGDNGGYQELVQGVLLCTALLFLPPSMSGTSFAYDVFVIPVEGAP